MLNLKNYRTRARGLPDLLPYAALIEPDVILCKDGSFLAAWELRGADTESSTDDDLATISARVSGAIRHLGSGWMLHVDSLRLPATDYPKSSRSFFPDHVSRMIDDARRKTFSSGEFHVTTTVLTVCWTPRSADATLKKLAHGKNIQKESSFLEQSLEAFKKTLLMFEDALSVEMEMDRLGSAMTASETFSPLLSFLQICLTGEDYLPRVPQTPIYLDALLGGQDLVGGLVPRIGRTHIAVIALDGLPSESWPSMLSGLSSLSFANRFSTRYICLDKFEALKEVDRYRKTWAQNIYKFFDKVFNKVNPRPDRDAVAMAQDAEDAYSGLQGDYFGAGLYTANIVLMNEHEDTLQEQIRIVRRLLLNIGFGCRLEEINALEAWLSTHPGNSFANVRRPMVSTLNLADFLPLASTWPGLETNPNEMYPPDSPALFQCATDSSTPFWFNLHVGDLGHTLIFGPTGSGKSTLLAIIAAQFRRYPQATIFAFDKGMSLFPLCVATGGNHYNVGGDGSPSFCPLSEIDTDADMTWAEEWIATLVNLQQDSKAVPPGYRQAIHATMLQLRSSPSHMRTLTSFVQLVQNTDIKQALRHYTLSGAMGHLLDASNDSLAHATFTTFEIENLMEMGEQNLLPVLLYLFRRIERNLKGQPALLILDEAWIMLSHPVFQGKIREWLRVLRKANCAVVLATQNLSDAVNSGILDVLSTNCPTKIMLPNSKAREDSSQALYRMFDLNDRQIDIISQARPKREYYIISPEGRRLVNLALTPLELAFVGASSKDNVSRIQALRTEYGDGWTDHWLKERGVA